MFVPDRITRTCGWIHVNKHVFVSDQITYTLIHVNKDRRVSMEYPFRIIRDIIDILAGETPRNVRKVGEEGTSTDAMDESIKEQMEVQAEYAAPLSSEVIILLLYAHYAHYIIRVTFSVKVTISAYKPYQGTGHRAHGTRTGHG